MKFAVRYPGGPAHEIVVDGAIAVVGRDPSCDLVLNDPKSSRRHAVVESGPGGLVIRDTGSANGIYVNGTKTERSPLSPGDVFRIGDVEVTIVGEHDEGTLVMDDLGFESLVTPPRTATLPPLESFPPPPPGAPPLPVRAAPSAGSTARAKTAPGGTAFRPAPRPLTVSVLAVLWVLSIPFHAVTGFLIARSRDGSGVVIGAVFVLITVVAAIMAFGLWTGRGWARPAQIVLAGLGILNCPFALAAIAALAYMLRAPARRYFARAGGDTTADQAESVFSAAIVAAVVLGALITAGLTIVARTARTGLP